MKDGQIYQEENRIYDNDDDTFLKLTRTQSHTHTNKAAVINYRTFVRKWKYSHIFLARLCIFVYCVHVNGGTTVFAVASSLSLTPPPYPSLHKWVIHTVYLLLLFVCIIYKWVVSVYPVAVVVSTKPTTKLSTRPHWHSLQKLKYLWVSRIINEIRVIYVFLSAGPKKQKKTPLYEQPIQGAQHYQRFQCIDDVLQPAHCTGSALTQTDTSWQSNDKVSPRVRVYPLHAQAIAKEKERKRTSKAML